MSKQPDVAGSNFRPKKWRNRPFCIFFCPNHIRQIFVVQKPNLSVFGLFEVFLNNKREFGLVGQPKQPAHKKIPAAKA